MRVGRPSWQAGQCTEQDTQFDYVHHCFDYYDDDYYYNMSMGLSATVVSALSLR